MTESSYGTSPRPIPPLLYRPRSRKRCNKSLGDDSNSLGTTCRQRGCRWHPGCNGVCSRFVLSEVRYEKDKHVGGESATVLPVSVRAADGPAAKPPAPCKRSGPAVGSVVGTTKATSCTPALATPPARSASANTATDVDSFAGPATTLFPGLHRNDRERRQQVCLESVGQSVISNRRPGKGETL